jgi:hypothetical protein
VSQSGGNVNLDHALAMVRELLRLHLAKHRHLPAAVVAVGGTALAAHRVRSASFDVDLYLSEVDDDIVAELNEVGRSRFGAQFKFDVTPVNTVWGHIAIKDIEQSPAFCTLEIADQTVPVRAITLETLYLLKAAAGRDKDLDDLSAIAPHVTLEAVLQRADQVLGWVGDRRQLPEYLETLSRMLARDFGAPVHEVEAAIAIPGAVRAKMAEMRRIRDVRLAIVLEPIIRRVADSIGPHPDRPEQLIFNVAASGASKQVLEIIVSRPDIVTSVAARVIEEVAPDRFEKWLKESAAQDDGASRTSGGAPTPTE